MTTSTAPCGPADRSGPADHAGHRAWRDARRLLRLDTLLRDLPPNLLVRQRAILDALCRMTGARTGWAALVEVDAGRPVGVRAVAGVDRDRPADADEPTPADDDALPALDCPWVGPLMGQVLARGGRLTTRTRDDLRVDLDAALESARAARPPGAPVPPTPDLGPAILSVGRLDPTPGPGPGDDSSLTAEPTRLGPVRLIKAIGLRRYLPADLSRRNAPVEPARLRPFTRRDVALVHAAHGRVDWLYRTFLDGPSADLAGVPDREREALHGLLAGEGEKQLARRLGRSPHTVHSWIKNLYRRFGVTSRAELLALFLDRRA